jgi:hypothetical protein
VQTLLSDPAASGSITLSGTSVVGDFEAPPTAYTIRGQKILLLKVTDAGS